MRISAAHRGSHDHDQGAGFAATGKASEAGKHGGTVTWLRHGPEHYRKMGKTGGAVVASRYGRQHFVEMGRLGGIAKSERQV